MKVIKKIINGFIQLLAMHLPDAIKSNLSICNLKAIVVAKTAQLMLLDKATKKPGTGCF